MNIRSFLAIGISILSLTTSTPIYAQNCEVALVLAIDVSRSVNAEEFGLIKDGTAEALRHPEVVELIGWLSGGVYATVTEWSGPEKQRQMIEWRHLKDFGSISDFASDIQSMKRVFRFDLTAPGNALRHAALLSESLPEKCQRYVIDISGDGVGNTGLDTNTVSNSVEKEGITINGLVVRGSTPDPLEFYHLQIRRGPLSFVEISDGYEDFPRAILRKLLRELSPNLSSLDEDRNNG